MLGLQHPIVFKLVSILSNSSRYNFIKIHAIVYSTHMCMDSFLVLS